MILFFFLDINQSQKKFFKICPEGFPFVLTFKASRITILFIDDHRAKPQGRIVSHSKTGPILGHTDINLWHFLNCRNQLIHIIFSLRGGQDGWSLSPIAQWTSYGLHILRSSIQLSPPPQIYFLSSRSFSLNFSTSSA